MQKNDPDKSSKLQELKTQYEKIQFSLSYKDSMIEKREILHQHIEQLKEKVSREKIECHKAYQSQLPSVMELEEKLGKHQLLLDESVQQLRELDAKIDDLEEYSIEQIFSMQQHIVADLINLFPEQKERYEKIDADLKKLETTHSEWNYIKQITEQLNLLLTALVNERKSVRGFGLLKYIFGVNPNIMITKYLREIDRLVQNEQKILDSFSHLEKDDLMYQKLKLDLKTVMKELEELSPKRWSFHIIDHGYCCYLDKVQEIKASIEAFGHHLETFVKQTNAKKEEWINEMLKTENK